MNPYELYMSRVEKSAMFDPSTLIEGAQGLAHGARSAWDAIGPAAGTVGTVATTLLGQKALDHYLGKGVERVHNETVSRAKSLYQKVRGGGGVQAPQAAAASQGVPAPHGKVVQFRPRGGGHPPAA